MVAYRLDFNIGNWIDGKYRIVEQIGAGAYGDVFKVVDSAGYPYALKLQRLWEVPSKLHASLVERFEQEFRTSNLQSEFLVHSKDFGIVQGNPYLVMEYCPYGDLSKITKSGRTDKLKFYARDVLEGLHVLHSAGKIHRDLKPENVLIRTNDTAALTDFGTVGEMDKNRRLSAVNWLNRRPKQMQGSPLYMAPEMFDRKGGGVTYLPTVDIWSFGVMMYELFTGGSFPFGDIETFEELPSYQQRARDNEWNRDKLRISSVGAAWIPIIEKCLAPGYANRYQSALEVLNDMQPMIGNTVCNRLQERLSRSTNISNLTITQGNNLGTSYYLLGRKNNSRMLRVGREAGNDIVLPEKDSVYVSRFHFTLEKSADGSFWQIRDGQWRKDLRKWVPSTNGTYLNATKVLQNGLKVFTGDIITAGEYKLKVE